MLERFAAAVWLILLTVSVAEASRLEGLWSGIARTAREQTRLQLEVSKADLEWHVRMTLPDVGVSGWPAASVEVERNGLMVTLQADSGPQTMTLKLTDNALSGSWHEPGYEEIAKIRLERIDATRSHAEKSVSIAGPAGALGASLVLPKGAGPFPGVVFLHGSGPQTRDASRWAAHSLGENGIASLIFDKRGTGDAEGSFDGTTLEQLARDGIAAAEFLVSQREVSVVGFAGHSQGGWVAPLAGSLWPSTAFVITSSGPAVPPSRETHWPVIRRMRGNGASHAQEEAARRLFDLWHGGLRSGDWTPFEQEFTRARDTPWFESSGIAWLMEKPSGEQLRSYLAIMDHDPIPPLKALDAPMLALLSPDDESIDAVETEGILRSLASSGNDIQITLYPGDDHGMRRRSARWPSLPEGYYENQTDFINRVVREPSTGTVRSHGRSRNEPGKR
jgi:dienelactone hydrolase